MSIAWGSSRGQSGAVAPDGTHEVRCYICRNTICRTQSPISRALCALCATSEEGKLLTAEALQSYMASRAIAGNVSMLVLEEKPPVIPGKKKFNLSTIGENVSLAIGFLRRRPDDNAVSAQIAKSKRRGRLLDNMSSDDVTGLGSMEDIDKMLGREPDER